MLVADPAEGVETVQIGEVDARVEWNHRTHDHRLREAGLTHTGPERPKGLLSCTFMQGGDSTDMTPA